MEAVGDREDSSGSDSDSDDAAMPGFFAGLDGEDFLSQPKRPPLNAQHEALRSQSCNLKNVGAQWFLESPKDDQTDQTDQTNHQLQQKRDSSAKSEATNRLKAKCCHFYAIRDFENAVTTCNQLLALGVSKPVKYEICDIAARSYLALGKANEALPFVDTLLARRDAGADVWKFKGELCKQLGDTKGRIDACMNAVKHSEYDIYLWKDLGDAFCCVENYELGWLCFDRCLKCISVAKRISSSPFYDQSYEQTIRSLTDQMELLSSNSSFSVPVCLNAVQQSNPQYEHFIETQLRKKVDDSSPPLFGSDDSKMSDTPESRNSVPQPQQEGKSTELADCDN